IRGLLCRALRSGCSRGLFGGRSDFFPTGIVNQLVQRYWKKRDLCAFVQWLTWPGWGGPLSTATCSGIVNHQKQKRLLLLFFSLIRPLKVRKSRALGYPTALPLCAFPTGGTCCWRSYTWPHETHG